MARSQRKAAQEAKKQEALPAHVKRAVTRQKQRKEQRKVRVWSADRPTRPEYDDVYLQIVSEFTKLGGSAWNVADKSGLSTGTVYAARHRTRKTGLGTTLQMMAKAAGGRLVFVKDN